MAKSMTIHLRVWRQAGPTDAGRLVSYKVDDVSPDQSFLELLDALNEGLIAGGKEPVEFESDCREGICGSCGAVLNGLAHGPDRGAALCQLHMRHFKDGDTIVVEPWRAKAFPVVRDLVVDRGGFDRIIAAGGFISVNTGQAPEASAIAVPRLHAELAMDAAACIGCGACVAACPNASAALFTAAKIAQLALLPQGRPERERRVVRMVERMDLEGFGNCSNHGECEAVCPKEISIGTIARMRREYLRALAKGSSADAA
jgi:succinate dehydrogenase / fumarate reductase, iron-sulfur subunit